MDKNVLPYACCPWAIPCKSYFTKCCSDWRDNAAFLLPFAVGVGIELGLLGGLLSSALGERTFVASQSRCLLDIPNNQISTQGKTRLVRSWKKR
eukprot:6460473-Amphidinium_carterae.1